MSYIGNQPAESYASFEKQVFTIVNSQTAYTLTHAVTNENDIRLVVNNVVQEPGSGKAYTAANTTLTLSAALVNGTDEMYCVYLGRALQTVNPPNASVGLSQLSATGTKDATTFLRGDNTFASAGGDNTPAFSARPNAVQAIANDTLTKVSFQTEDFDTDNAFASDKFTVPSGKAGKYYFEATFLINSATDKQFAGYIYKNGSRIFYSIGKEQTGGGSATSATATASVILDLAVGDYIEFYIYQDTGSSKNTFDTYTKFQGFKLI
jgi:hypothetical protein